MATKRRKNFTPKVLALYTSGIHSPKEIGLKLGVSGNRVSSALTKLRKAGRLEMPANRAQQSTHSTEPKLKVPVKPKSASEALEEEMVKKYFFTKAVVNAYVEGVISADEGMKKLVQRYEP